MITNTRQTASLSLLWRLLFLQRPLSARLIAVQPEGGPSAEQFSVITAAQAETRDHTKTILYPEQHGWWWDRSAASVGFTRRGGDRLTPIAVKGGGTSAGGVGLPLCC